MPASGDSVSLPPGPRAPAAVQTLRWMSRPVDFMERCDDRYGECFTVRIVGEGTWVFVSEPKALKQVFTGDPGVMHAGEANAIFAPLLGRASVMLLEEDEHLRLRKLMLPPFHGDRMRQYGELIGEIAERQIDGWPKGEPFAAWPRMRQIALEVIIRAIFGIETAGRVAEVRRLLEAMFGWTSKPSRLMLAAVLGTERLESSSWTKLPRLRADLDAVIYQEIERRRAVRDLDERADVLSLLLGARFEDGSGLSDGELRDQLITLVVAGHETTATAMAWALERLVRHPDAAAQAREAAEGEDDAYLVAAIKETLRVRPVIPAGLRRLAEPLEVDGHVLPAGTSVAPCIYLAHRKPDAYPEPGAFRPERFVEGAAGTYSWIPFGGGVRRCLGAGFALFEMRTVLGTVLRSLDLRPARAESEPVVRRLITLGPGRGAEVVAEPRA